MTTFKLKAGSTWNEIPGYLVAGLTRAEDKGVDGDQVIILT